MQELTRCWSTTRGRIALQARQHLQAVVRPPVSWKEAVALMRENDEEMDAAAVVARQDAPYAVLALLCHLAAAKPPEGSVAGSELWEF